MDVPEESEKYKVRKFLGSGTYGSVYKVQSEADNCFYALKVVELSDVAVARAAVQEARLLQALHSDHVIRFHDALLSGSKLLTIEEYAPLGDLKYYIKKGHDLGAPFPEEAVWRILLQLSSGLATLHSMKIIHRDIKPANIFMFPADETKIGDLGMAKVLRDNHKAHARAGTPLYMAPEVWSGRPYTCSSDLWSLGCVLYEMMTFRRTFDADSEKELQVKVTHGMFEHIKPGHYSAELVKLCHALLSLDPERRPQAEAIVRSPEAAKWLWLLPKLATSLSERLPKLSQDIRARRASAPATLPQA